MGKSPALVANPTSIRTVANCASDGAAGVVWPAIAVHDSVSRGSIPAAIATCANATIPSSAKPIPTLQSTRYFQAASSAVASPLKPTRKAVASVVAEIPSHSAAKLSAKQTTPRPTKKGAEKKKTAGRATPPPPPPPRGGRERSGRERRG